jgi:Zn-dependent protease
MNGIHLPMPSAASAGPALPILSRSSLWLLFLLPFAFVPIFRVTFPHVGLWPAAAIVLLAVALLLRPSGAVDRRLAFAGLVVAGGVAFCAAVAARSAEIVGDVPAFHLDEGATETAWAVRLISFAVLFFSITVHECAHALTAWLSGDSTAKERGRLTLNPMAHIDLFGTIILPAVLSVVPGGFAFGWAKPVPVDPRRFRHPRRGRLAVSVAGVAANLALALLSASLLGVVGTLLHLTYPQMASHAFMNPWRSVEITGLPYAAVWSLVIEALKHGVTLNMILFSLNILPIPPLDGFGLLEGLVRENVRAWLEKCRGWGSIVFIALVFTSALNYLILPGVLVAMFLNYTAGAMAKLG